MAAECTCQIEETPQGRAQYAERLHSPFCPTGRRDRESAARFGFGVMWAGQDGRPELVAVCANAPNALGAAQRLRDTVWPRRSSTYYAVSLDDPESYLTESKED